MWQFISHPAEAMRRLGDRRDLNQEEWKAHYAKLRAERNERPWYTGVIGSIYGVTVYRSKS